MVNALLATILLVSLVSMACSEPAARVVVDPTSAPEASATAVADGQAVETARIELPQESTRAATPTPTPKPKPTATASPTSAPSAAATLTPASTSQILDEPDREALTALYNATDGANWLVNHGWLTDAPIGEWYGVRINHQGRVGGLILNGNRFSGEIPAEVGSLVNLRVPALPGNRLVGDIPPELGSAVDLACLWLNRNQLTGEIPAELGNLVGLEELYLRRNQLTGEIPPTLGNLADSARLFLSGNQLSGCVPARLHGRAVSDLPDC